MKYAKDRIKTYLIPMGITLSAKHFYDQLTDRTSGAEHDVRSTLNMILLLEEKPSPDLKTCLLLNECYSRCGEFFKEKKEIVAAIYCYEKSIINLEEWVYEGYRASGENMFNDDIKIKLAQTQRLLALLYFEKYSFLGFDAMNDLLILAFENLTHSKADEKEFEDILQVRDKINTYFKGRIGTIIATDLVTPAELFAAGLTPEDITTSEEAPKELRSYIAAPVVYFALVNLEKCREILFFIRDNFEKNSKQENKEENLIRRHFYYCYDMNNLVKEFLSAGRCVFPLNLLDEEKLRDGIREELKFFNELSYYSARDIEVAKELIEQIQYHRLEDAYKMREDLQKKINEAELLLQSRLDVSLSQMNIHASAEQSSGKEEAKPAKTLTRG